MTSKIPICLGVFKEASLKVTPTKSLTTTTVPLPSKRIPKELLKCLRRLKVSLTYKSIYLCLFCHPFPKKFTNGSCNLCVFM